ncbi:unnamed protein product [Effrenium voratum]|nr:unnamed protein product [Effrenium voratum]
MRRPNFAKREPTWATVYAVVFNTEGLGGCSHVLALPQRSSESISGPFLVADSALASAELAHQLMKGHWRLRAGVLAISAASAWGEEQTDIRKPSLTIVTLHC